jgi:putative ABC transport system permease protein
MKMTQKKPIVSRIASQSYQTNPLRNMVIIIAITLTTVMFTSILTIGFSIIQSMAQLGSSVADGSNMQGMMIMACGILIVLVSGYLIIYNIFQISVTQSIRFYGQLKALGAVNQQIKRILVIQALKLSSLGIPLGLLIGYGLGAIVMPVVLVSLGSSAILSINPLIFIGGAVFSLITVLFSCAKPAAIAGKVAPVVAMKYIDSDANIKRRKKYRLHRITPKNMASENLKRNKKRTAISILSISMGFMLMNGFYVMQHSFDKNTYIKNFLQSDIAITSSAVNDTLKGSDNTQAISLKMQKQINNMQNILQTGNVYYTEQLEQINVDVLKRLSAYYEDESNGASGWVQSDPAANSQYKALKQTGKTTVGIYGVNNYTAQMGKIYLGKFDAKKFQTGNYIIGLGLADNGEGSIHYAIGDKIEISGRNYELMAMMEPVETISGMVHSPNNELGINYAIYETSFQQSFPNILPLRLFIETNTNGKTDSIVAALQKDYPNYTIVTKQTYELQFQEQVMAQSIMGYILGIIMAFIGILNFVNSMLTAIVTRKREFAMLQSIGMTKLQLKKMLVHEGIGYAAISLTASLILATLFSVTIIQETVSTSWAASYNFTLLPFAMIGPIVLVLTILIPIVCFLSTNKKSLIERLRETE